MPFGVMHYYWLENTRVSMLVCAKDKREARKIGAAEMDGELWDADEGEDPPTFKIEQLKHIEPGVSGVLTTEWPD